jgi:hypothetical protein
MVELKLKYVEQTDIDVRWMMDVDKNYSKPDSLEVTTSNQLLETEKAWLSDTLSWVYKDNDNRDIKVNGEFYIVDDFTNA